ncbi:MAG: TIGR03546 family protein [Pirellulaceae bacterium]|nr:TIGR03546 family protein [Pirellulaceae bacterium]
MVGSKGNRRLWLLKSTSDHHAPGRLAAAIALGFVAGLVPKANLLAVILYAALLLLPVHTLLGLVISAVVMLLAYRLDPLSSAIGNSLLMQPALRPLWFTLESAPIVPWLALHNTVVLGSLVLGLASVAPVYLVALRLFEHLEYGGSRARSTTRSYAPVQPDQPEPLIAPRTPQRHTSAPDRHSQRDRRSAAVPLYNEPSSQPTPRPVTQPVIQPTNQGMHSREMPRPPQLTPQSLAPSGAQSSVEPAISPLIIPPPKLNRAAQPASFQSRVADVDQPDELERVVFEPVQEVSPIINSWHMGRAAGENQTSDLIASGVGPRSLTAHASGGTQPENVHKDSIDSLRSRSGADAEAPPFAFDHGDVVDSLQLAQSASEVLAWVDELLDECLAEEGMTIVTHHYDTLHAPVDTAEPVDQLDVSPQSDSVSQVSEHPWLMETTLEIVRWADDCMTLDHSTAQEFDQHSEWAIGRLSQAEHGQEMLSQQTNAERSFRAPSEGRSILPMNVSIAEGQSDPHSGADFEHLVMAEALKNPAPATLPLEPMRGESLGYLLGHLRQTREGKNT